MTRIQKIKKHLVDNAELYAAGTTIAALLGLVGYAIHVDVENYNATLEEYNKAKAKLQEWGEQEFSEGRIVTALNDGTIVSLRPEEIKFYS